MFRRCHHRRIFDYGLRLKGRYVFYASVLLFLAVIGLKKLIILLFFSGNSQHEIRCAIILQSRQCFARNLTQTSPEEIWNTLPAMQKHCMSPKILKEIYRKTIHIRNEIYRLSPFKPDPFWKEHIYGVVVTLGIDNDLDTERKIRKAFPGFKFWAADPSSKKPAVKQFKKFGEYSNFAVGEKEGNAVALVWRDVGARIEKVKFVDVVKYFNDHVRATWIDILTIDNEANKYDIMKVIGETDIDTIPPVCQFNVYLHETVSPEKLHPIMTKLIDRGYVIVRAVKNNGYLYLFMAQAHSTFCLERYTGDQCKSHFKPSLHEEEVV